MSYEFPSPHTFLRGSKTFMMNDDDDDDDCCTVEYVMIRYSSSVYIIQLCAYCINTNCNFKEIYFDKKGRGIPNECIVCFQSSLLVILT